MITLVLFVLGSIIAATEGCGAGKQLIRSGGLSAYEKQAIVDAHNRLRQSVALGQVSSQPPAANMMEMVWDDELAATAQRWSDQCIPAHDRAAQRDVGRFPVGQNLAATWTTRPPSEPADSQPDFMKQINAWFDEVRIYGFKPINGGHGTGHYSQLVWGETSHVGCGFTFYFDKVRGYTKLYVCNYGPGGNVIGANPYEKGSPSCSAYGLSESSKYSGLCAASFTSSSSYQTVDNYNNNGYISNAIPDSTGETKGFNYHFFKEFNNQFQYQIQQQQQQQQPRTFLPADPSSLKALQQQPRTFLPANPSALKALQEQPRVFLPADPSSLKALQQQPRTFLPADPSAFKALQQQPRTFLPADPSAFKALQQQPRTFLPADPSAFKALQQQPRTFLPADPSAFKALQQQPRTFFKSDSSSSSSSLLDILASNLFSKQKQNGYTIDTIYI